MASNRLLRRGSPQLLTTLKGTPRSFLKEDAEEDWPLLMTQGVAWFCAPSGPLLPLSLLTLCPSWCSSAAFLPGGMCHTAATKKAAQWARVDRFPLRAFEAGAQILLTDPPRAPPEPQVHGERPHFSSQASAPECEGTAA